MLVWLTLSYSSRHGHMDKMSLLTNQSSVLETNDQSKTLEYDI